MSFTFEPYTEKSLILRTENGGREHPSHKHIVGHLQGRWNEKANGWLLPKRAEKDIAAWIQSISPQKKDPIPKEENRLDEIKTHLKSRRNQKKYHRSVSSGDGEENESLATFATLSRRSLRGVDIDCSDNASEELLVIKFSFSLSRDENMGPKPLGRRKLFVRTRPPLSTKTPEGNVVRILCIATESIIQLKEEETFSKSVWRLYRPSKSSILFEDDSDDSSEEIKLVDGTDTRDAVKEGASFWAA
jgi:hypothetical protein